MRLGKKLFESDFNIGYFGSGKGLIYFVVIFLVIAVNIIANEKIAYIDSYVFYILCTLLAIIITFLVSFYKDTIYVISLYENGFTVTYLFKNKTRSYSYKDIVVIRNVYLYMGYVIFTGTPFLNIGLKNLDDIQFEESNFKNYHRLKSILLMKAKEATS